ncbi:MAG: MaoC family dehydratase [Neptuniibacter sp.]
MDANKSLYLEDIAIGQIFRNGFVTIAEDKIISFAQEYDPQPFHLDAGAADNSLFRGLAASGWHTAAITMRLLVEGGAPFAGGLIGAGVEITWPQPTRPGDTLRIVSTVINIKLSSTKDDRGIVTIKTDTFNQHDSVVQSMISKLVVFRRLSDKR